MSDAKEKARELARKIVQRIYEVPCSTPTPIVEHIIEEGMAVYAAEAVEAERKACAEIARNHGKTIGEHCWNHENRFVNCGFEGAETTCSEEIAADIERRKP